MKAILMLILLVPMFSHAKYFCYASVNETSGLGKDAELKIINGNVREVMIDKIKFNTHHDLPHTMVLTIDNEGKQIGRAFGLIPKKKLDTLYFELKVDTTRTASLDCKTSRIR